MGAPDFQSVLLPLLRLVSDEQEHALREAIDALANEVSLTESERKELLPNGDGGIDGILKEDRLGLGIIYIEAKRWDTNNTVERPEVQKFAGALQGHRAKKGIFITTSDFSKEALDFVSRIDSKIVLIDGETLAQHMIDHSVGVSAVAPYEVKKIDSDYFLEP